MIAVDVVKARGHPNVRATHKSTLEITRDPELTRRGDCIIAVNADKGASQLSHQFRELAANDNTHILIVLVCGELIEVVRAWGCSCLTFSSPSSIVIRRSTFVDGRTVAVRSDKAALHLDRRMIALLRRSAELRAHFFAYTEDEKDAEPTILELFKRGVGRIGYA